jgi:hypothetical protein
MFIPSLGFHFPAMKNYFTSLLSITAMSCLVATAASCSDRRKDPDPTVKSAEANPAPESALPPTGLAALPVVTPAAPVPADLFAKASATLDNTKRDQASILTSLPDKLNRTIDANIAAWKAKGGVSTEMSESKLELARTDFNQKIRTLTLADDETWKNARGDAQSSLENLRRAYGELMAGKIRN